MRPRASADLCFKRDGRKSINKTGLEHEFKTSIADWPDRPIDRPTDDN